MCELLRGGVGRKAIYAGWGVRHVRVEMVGFWLIDEKEEELRGVVGKGVGERSVEEMSA